MKIRSYKRIIFFDIAVIIAFLFAICLPGIRMLLHENIDRAAWKMEQRSLPPQFPTDLRSVFPFVGKYREYFNANFGLRHVFIQATGFVKLKCFGVSSSPKVLIGKRGWLFLSANGESDCYVNRHPFTQEELAHWKYVLEARRDWLAKQGIPYIFVIAPDKHTVYPEFMPSYIQQVHKRSRLDQLIAYLKANSDLDIMDLRPLLLDAKDHQIYYKYDTHWNQLGGYIAYREMAKRLNGYFPQVPIPPLSPQGITHTTTGGDLAGMIGLRDYLLEDKPRVILEDSGPAIFTWDAHRNEPNPPNGMVDRLESSCPSGEIRRAVIFRDSFTTTLTPLLSQRFNHAVYLWTSDLHTPAVTAEHPDVVIQVMVERFLTTIEKPNALTDRPFPVTPAQLSGHR